MTDHLPFFTLAQIYSMPEVVHLSPAHKCDESDSPGATPYHRFTALFDVAQDDGTTTRKRLEVRCYTTALIPPCRFRHLDLGTIVCLTGEFSLDEWIDPEARDDSDFRFLAHRIALAAPF